MAKVLLIEDDTSVAQALMLGLRRLDHEVEHLPDGNRDLLEPVRRNEILVLDLGLPGRDGFDICRTVAAQHELPILVLTARSDDIDVVASLEAGADDYVTKPVSPRVLDARIKALLRRAARAGEEPVTQPRAVSRIGDLEVDEDTMEVRRSGAVLDLTPTELRMMVVFARNANRVLSRDELFERVWGSDFRGDSRVVDTTMQRLRAKVEADPRNPSCLLTVRGFGYRLSPGRGPQPT
ncbi:DNA-binding response regulator [Flexivirga endophytica]|uniref:DNA-binding response regulator n=1 Tax=Flexivirga endophytica TaxID=1849103 RepID=A0A916TAI3_9MICO|nr:response regulator transcription factor [Flexivirga endophytica]GGB36135.1 DNA-binding response regulator [Flexivirga endophytica]GHB43900.1 DNA-binding response regulator [Flexivirga endophytica]